MTELIAREGLGRPLRGYRSRMLIRDLAVGQGTQEALAEKYGVTQQAISQFRQANLEKIQAVIEDVDNDFAELWIAVKANRLAECEGNIARLDELIGKPNMPALEVIRLQQHILRQAAEELGHLRQNVDVNHRITRYVVEGVDPEADYT